VRKNDEPEGQYMYNVTLRSIRVPIIFHII